MCRHNIFHLPGDTLTFTTATEHTIPTPIDPMRGINTKSYRIPEIHREEVQKQTEQMLCDGIIVPSSSPWNSPILVIPKKTDESTANEDQHLHDVDHPCPTGAFNTLEEQSNLHELHSTGECSATFLCISPCDDAREVISMKTEEGKDTEVKVEESPEPICFPEIKAEPDDIDRSRFKFFE